MVIPLVVGVLTQLGYYILTGTMPAALRARYGCTDWQNYIDAIWPRYYQLKKNKLDDVGNRFELAMD
jgi:hypothetical protein